MASENPEWEQSATDVLLRLAYDEALVREREMLAAADGGHDLTWMLWQTAPCIVVPLSHVNHSGFEAAMDASAARGWPVRLRDTGGGAVVQNSGVINLSMVFSIDASLHDRIGTGYRILCEPVMQMLRDRGMQGAYRAIPGTMCDGAYNIVVGTRKLAGTAQRWRSLGRDRPGEHAILAHLAMFVSLDHIAAAEAINALYIGAGMDAGIEASTHVNWTEIDTTAEGDAAASTARKLDAACRTVRLDKMFEQALMLQESR